MSVQTTKRIAAGFAFIVVVTGVVEMTPVEAATFTVNSTADEPDAAPGNGVCATSAGVCTLRAAVQETNAMGGQDTIIMPAGTYIVTSRIQVQDSVDLLGANAATTIVSGASAHPIFDITPSAGSTPTVNLHRLTLRDGRTELTDAGAALVNREGAITRLWDSLVRNNESNIAGGAIHNRGKLHIIRSEIRNNRLPEGGGGVTSSGGAIYNIGELEVACSAVTENFATRGGGIFNINGVAKIKHSTISSNQALGGGGGIRNVGTGRLFIASSTVTLNRGNEPGSGSEAKRTGGGIQTIAPATVWMSATIVAGNTDNRSRFEPEFSPDCSSDAPGSFITRRSNLFGVVNNQCQMRDAISGPNTSFDLKGTDTAPLDPQLNGLINNGGDTRTHALRVGSPAIDANTAAASSGLFACDPVDQRGRTRPIDGDGNGQPVCDIGAYEHHLTPSTVNPGACDTLQFTLPDEVPPSAPGGLNVR